MIMMWKILTSNSTKYFSVEEHLVGSAITDWNLQVLNQRNLYKPFYQRAKKTKFSYLRQRLMNMLKLKMNCFVPYLQNFLCGRRESSERSNRVAYTASSNSRECVLSKESRDERILAYHQKCKKFKQRRNAFVYGNIWTWRGWKSQILLESRHWLTTTKTDIPSQRVSLLAAHHYGRCRLECRGQIVKIWR